ncbi:MAG: hypothetical protein WBQ44_15515 [Rhodococcus sp. (in: high G+C Gram-positive bacteria)]
MSTVPERSVDHSGALRGGARIEDALASMVEALLCLAEWSRNHPSSRADGYDEAEELAARAVARAARLAEVDPSQLVGPQSQLVGPQWRRYLELHEYVTASSRGR